MAMMAKVAGLAVAVSLSIVSAASAASPSEVLDSVVGLRTEVPAEARTAPTLGRERFGSAVAIDDSGLFLTIGYLIIEASAVDLQDRDGKRVPADVVAYDHESGLALLRARAPLAARGVPLGSAAGLAIGDALLAVARIDRVVGSEARLVDRREFAGYWEYLLPQALFTSPPFPPHSGAALIDRNGSLVGIGSLVVEDAASDGVASPGNMYVPIDALKPVLSELLATGRRDAPPRPWLGITSRELDGGVIVGNTANGGPAAAAGIVAGDRIVGVGDHRISGLADLYRAVWGLGAAGVPVPLRVLRDGRPLELDVRSIDRNQWLKLRQSY